MLQYVSYAGFFILAFIAGGFGGAFVERAFGVELEELCIGPYSAPIFFRFGLDMELLLGRRSFRFRFPGVAKQLTITCLPVEAWGIPSERGKARENDLGPDYRLWVRFADGLATLLFAANFWAGYDRFPSQFFVAGLVAFSLFAAISTAGYACIGIYRLRNRGKNS